MLSKDANQIGVSGKVVPSAGQKENDTQEGEQRPEHQDRGTVRRPPAEQPFAHEKMRFRGKRGTFFFRLEIVFRIQFCYVHTGYVFVTRVRLTDIRARKLRWQINYANPRIRVKVTRSISDRAGVRKEWLQEAHRSVEGAGDVPESDIGEGVHGHARAKSGPEQG